VPRAEPSDADLIRDSLRDPETFRRFFERHYDAVRRYAQRALGIEAGEEIAAQTFLVAFERRRSFDLTYRSARPWLYGIAHNTIRHHLRSQGVIAQTFARMPGERDASDVVDVERLEAAYLAPVLAAALAAIPDEYREPFLLVALADLSYREVSEILGLPAGTVRSRIHRAKAALRELIPFPEETSDEDRERPAGRGDPAEDTRDG
jgi:RNA polymerase sigma-70 factor (ECF subfamily)